MVGQVQDGKQTVQIDWTVRALVRCERPVHRRSWSAISSCDHRHFITSSPHGTARSLRPCGEAIAPGGPHRPLAGGLFNVHGNVWEWTSDCWRAKNKEDGSRMTVACARSVGVE